MLDKTVRQIAYLWIILICALYLLSPLFPDMRLWGINHLRFADSIAPALAVIFMAVSFLPQFRDGFHRIVNRLHSGYLSADKDIYLGFSVCIYIFSVAIFYIFRTTVHLLGDGYLRGDEIRAGFSRLSLPTEPLDSIIHWIMYKILGPLTGWGVHQVFELSSAIIGGFFVLAILNLTRPSGKISISPLLIFLGLGGIFFYFGYEESYSLLFMGLFIYLIYAYRFLKGENCYGCLMLIFTVTFFTHFSSIYILPSYLFLIAVAIKERKIGRNHIILSLASLLLIAGGFIYLHYFYRPEFFTEHAGFLLPFGFDGYKLFSPAHLMDIVNNYLLSGTLAVLLIPLIILSGVFGKLNRDIKIFALILIIQSIGFVLFFDPKLGLARDWDLFSSTGILAVFAVYIFFTEDEDISRKFGGIMRTATLVTLVFTVSYIGINSSYNRSIERFEDILRFYDQRSAYGYETLGGQYVATIAAARIFTRQSKATSKLLRRSPIRDICWISARPLMSFITIIMIHH